MLNLSAGLSALQANQIAMDVIGNNIANVNTSSYHRQEARFETRDSVDIGGGHRIGTGVSISHIQRFLDEATEAAILENNSALNAIQPRLDAANRIETLLRPGEGSVLKNVEAFFNELEGLTASPDTASSLAIVTQSAHRIATSINELARDISSITSDIDAQIEKTLAEIEQLSEDIVNINAKIRSAEVRGQSPNDLLDQRQRMLNDLSMLIDVQPGKQTNFDSDVSFVEDRYQLADGFLTFATVPLELKTVVNDEGMLLINRVGKQVEFPVTTGRLGGLLEARNGLAEKYLTSFNEFASVLIGRLDTIHATGVGLNKGFSNLVGQRSVSDINAPLSSLELFSPIQQGNLYVTVIAPDGTKSLHELAINPDTQSTSDLADAFDAIPNLQGIADAASGTLTVLADPDYQFNFTGAVPNQVDDSSMSGTSRPDFSGIYTGVQNRKLTFQFAEDGTIGQPEELRVNVIDQSGSLVATLDLGNEYEPGTELLVTDGVEVAFAPGTVVNGDSFQVDLIADPDTTGVLAALGINSLFEGSALGDLAVNSSILRDPSLLATRHSGDALDTTNATRLLRVRGESLFSNGTQTAHEYFTEIIASSGVAVAELAADEQSLTVAANALEEKRQGLSGVDPNEEVVRMLQFQRSFQAAARYISSVEETLDELFNILR